MRQGLGILERGGKGSLRSNQLVIGFVLLSLFSLSWLNCATTGPRVTRSEESRARAALRAPVVRQLFDNLTRVCNVGYRLMASLPGQEAKKPIAYSGILTADLTDEMRKAYQVENEKGVLVLGVLKGSPADNVGMARGDVIIKLGEKEVTNRRDYLKAFSETHIGENMDVTVVRETTGTTLLGPKCTLDPNLRERNAASALRHFGIKVASLPIKVSFQVVDRKDINAGATSDMIIVTYGLLDFVRSDDELAVVLGHELAHIVKNHLTKKRGLSLLSGLAKTAVQTAAPGIGDVGGEILNVASAAFQMKFSRDYEREADYFGLYFANYAGYDIKAGVDVWHRFSVQIPESQKAGFLSTHPSSPERMVRMEKTIEEIQANKFSTYGIKSK